jgi:FtsP/CotA-like multicopper oxidase with cupredoxin domain
MPKWLAGVALAALTGLTSAPAARLPDPEAIAPNDNRHAVGTLDHGVLTVALEARLGTWRPEGEGGRALEVAAFAEEGKALSTPGPLLRVPVGTEVRATIRNRLDRPLVVYGFGARAGRPDSAVVPADGATPVRFRADEPGTYFYWAQSRVDTLGLRLPEEAQLNGVIVVDPPGARPDSLEHVFALSWWCPIDTRSPSGIARCTMAMNGLSWPHTERLHYAEGDSVHWRVVNFTELDHPMHLHGFFFRVDSKGSAAADTLYAPDQRRMAVTEVLHGFRTMTLAWQAARPGNWIFHCHYAIHLSHLVALDTENGMLDSAMLAHHASEHPPHQMFGLVTGITIAPSGRTAVATERPRAIRLVQREKPNVYGSQPGMSYVVDGTPASRSADSMPVPGPLLVLERGKRVAVKIVNQSQEPAAVHWHGIELESYSDGVPGWSGAGDSILPSIRPHDSLVVRWTPPRAGSYMYHSHFNESMQMGSGLYGPIVVLEPGRRFDPATDRILFFGTAGSTTNPVIGPYPRFLLNGKTDPPPMSLKVGTTYRFRLFDLAGDEPLRVSLDGGGAPVTWQAVAKDGFELPATQRTAGPAVLVFEPGEIYDFTYTPTTRGDLSLSFGPVPGPPGGPPPSGPTVTVPVRVR